MSLIRKRKKQFCVNWNIKDVTDYKKFWKTSKPLFSNKTKPSNTIILLEKDKVITDNSEIPKTLNSYLTNMAKSLKVPESENINRLHMKSSIRPP